MKIAIDARILRTSTGRYVERLLHYLQEMDHDNQYVILLDAKDYDGWEPTAPNFSKYRIDIPNYSFKEQINLAIVLHKINADLVHFIMPQQPLAYFKPSVTTIHDLTLLNHKNYDDNSVVVYNVKQFIFRFILQFAARKSRAVMVPTEYVKHDLSRSLGVPEKKISVTPESADASPGGSKPITLLDKKPFIMYVGRMDPYKNIRRLIQAHQLLLKTHPDLLLALPGRKDGNVQAIEQWTKEQGYKNVHFLGFVSDDQLRWMYEHTGSYVVASLSEGFGLPGLEAMNYGTPLASSNATCLPEVYKDGAHYFDPTDIEDMAAKIKDVIEKPELRKDLIGKGKKVAASYSWERMTEQTLEVYNRALKKDS